LHRGAADYILKPVNAEALRANLRRVAKAWHLAQQLRLLATAVRDIEEGVLITDAELAWPGPRIVFVNEALTRITGYSEQEMLGGTPRMFQSPRTDRRIIERLKAELAQGKPFTGEIVNRRKDGTEYFVELHVSPVHDPSGRVTNYVSTQRDVTSRKRAEERLLQSERLAAIGQMVTGLAHESRNALQRSKACLEMLAIEVEDRPEALDLVERVHKAQNHLHHLYEEVRGYAAPLNLKRQRISLAEVWRETWSQLEVMRAGRDATLREEIEGLDLEVEVDAFAIGQVFRNIFENAIAACPDPCEIVVGCMPVRLSGRAALQVSICDNGPGLSPEQAQRIFDPFYTTKTKGTGLGMAIAKRIVEAHGGRIAVGSGTGRGAELVVTLPRDWHDNLVANFRCG
jgi:PAS domain S-box-containing protein